MADRVWDMEHRYMSKVGSGLRSGPEHFLLTFSVEGEYGLMGWPEISCMYVHTYVFTHTNQLVSLLRTPPTGQQEDIATDRCYQEHVYQAPLVELLSAQLIR